MKAVIFDGNKLFLKNIPNPIAGKNQALIYIHAIGVCGTDLAIVNGKISTPVPIILGHEFAGEIIDINNKNLKQHWIGKRVTSEINTNTCGTCFYCKQGISTHCIKRKALGIHTNGAMAEFIAVDINLLHEIPDSISYNEATFIEPLAAAYQTFEMMPLTSHDKTIAVFGMGKLGLLLLQVAKQYELEIIAVDGSEHKLRIAKKLGASFIINHHKEKDIPQKIKTKWENGADIVIDATGNPNALDVILSSCRSRGKIHIKSTHGISAPINLTEIVQREIIIYTSRCGTFSKAIQGLKTQKVKVNDLISKIFPLERAVEAFEPNNFTHKHIRTLITT
jgi:alcohol dehydrogenase